MMEDDMIVLEGIRGYTSCIVCAQILDEQKRNCKDNDSSEKLPKSPEKVAANRSDNTSLVSILLKCLADNNEHTNTNNLGNFHDNTTDDSEGLLHVCQICERNLVEFERLSKEVLLLNRRLQTLKYTVIAKFVSAAGNQEDGNNAGEHLSLTWSRLEKIRRRLRTEFMPNVMLENLSPWQSATVPMSTEWDAADDGDFTENHSNDDHWPSDASCGPEMQGDDCHGKVSQPARSIRRKKRYLKCKQVGPNEFLYAEKYKIFFDGAKYSCGLCSSSLFKRNTMTTHIRRIHMRNKKSIPNVVLEKPSELVSVPVSTEWDAVDDNVIEHTADDDCWPCDAMMKNGKKKEPCGKKIGNKLRCIPAGPNEFLYAEKFKISFDGVRYSCGKCSYFNDKKDNVLTHIRRRHIRDNKLIPNFMSVKLSASQLASVPVPIECDAIDENGTEHKPCPFDVSMKPQGGNCHGEDSKTTRFIRKNKRKKNDPAENKIGGNLKCKQVGPNEFLYADKFKISFDGVKYSCGLCSSSVFRKGTMLTHIRRNHMRDIMKTRPVRPQKLVAVKDTPNKFHHRRKYEVDLIAETGAYKCTLCGQERESAIGIMEHIDRAHYAVDKHNWRAGTSTKLIAPNEFLYNGKYPFKYVSTQQTYSCGLCEYQNDNLHCIYPHIRTSHYTSQDKQEFTAVQVSENEYLYVGKFRVFFKDGKYTCGICSCQRFSLQELYSHIRSRHTDAEAEKINPEDVQSKGDVSVEVNNNAKYDFNCRGIPYSYNGLSRKFTCGVCSVSVGHRSSIFAHINRFHAGRTRQYVCEVCGDSFHGERYLRRHQSRHEAPKYTCQHCGKLFRSVKSFKCHVALHELGDKAKTFQCEYCGKKFSTKSFLNNHVRIHTGEKPYKCDLCDELFADTAKVFYHKKIVHGIVPKKKFD